MKKQEFLSIVRKQIRFVFDRDKIENELKQHLADSIEELIEEGFSWEDAEHIAVEQMGNPKEVGQLLNKEHNPILGYLWTISRVVLCIFVCRIAIQLGMITFSLITTMKPYVPKYSVESYAVNLEMDLPTHRVKIDNICLNESNQYFLTFRAWTKREYSRAGWSSNFFTIEDKEGELAGGSTQTMNSFVSYGTKDFEWPEDSVLYLVGRDGNVIELNLEEYCDEKR